MMPPSLLMIGARRVRLPLPVFLFWPILALAWLCVGLPWLLMGMPRRGWTSTGVQGLACYHALRGLLIDVNNANSRVYLHFI